MVQAEGSKTEAQDISSILDEVRGCTSCKNLPFGPRPILQMHPEAKILIAGQAPGRKTHSKGIPFDDPSGDRLREWMGVSREVFYNEKNIAILPMAFCYPGSGKSGDFSPPTQCAEQWREPLLKLLPNVRLTLVIGQYAIAWHLKDKVISGLEDRATNKQFQTLTETVMAWQSYWPQILPMPHPSPRNNRWLKNNPWFVDEVLPELKKQVSFLLREV